MTETPEIKLARENTKNISDVSLTHTRQLDYSNIKLIMFNVCVCVCVQVQYRESVGTGTALTHTPEMERVRRNQENISDVHQI